ncbi:spermatogenesis-associated protein 5-like protein 1 [Hermetia illucens]|uniref:spermatogenesis-associated protein 5-like protein 1 n=1 Tax=Hermetia illucens TaxID=343691 RepID=UPI0018CC1D4D|nr:spermatogenesis-associated protein 5-like protein 1 [Hermetia illucens]
MIPEASKNLSFNVELKLVPNHSSIENCSQKCLLPSEKFPAGVAPGSLSICTINSKQYVCFLFPMNNNFPVGYCAIDNCVSIKKSSECPENVANTLTHIRIIETPVEPFREIKVKINLNKSLFETSQRLTRSKLAQAARTFLSLYSFTANSTIELYDRANNFGIDSIEILSGECDSVVGNISAETTFFVESIRYLGTASFLNTVEIAGVDNVICELDKVATECFLHGNWKSSGINQSHNALIVGPTGCGKTSICHNFVIKNKCNVFAIQSSDMMKPLPGETEEALRKVFADVRYFVEHFQPLDLTVILIENIDLLCPADVKTSNDKSQTARICGQFTSLVDDLQHIQNGNVLILATTSNLELVNTALRRPGRFKNEIFIHPPNEREREEILILLLRKESELGSEDKVELAKWVASRTPGYVGADLVSLVNFANRERCKGGAVSNNLTSLQFYKQLFTDALKMVKASSLRGTDVSIISSDLTFDHIGGMESLKKSLSVSILSSFKNPEAFRRFGLQPPKGILLYGPPGCAKTMIAKCLANEANMTFIATSGAEIYSPYVGDAEKFILKIFNTARKNAPCLIFFDEIDALVGSRQIGTSGSDVQTRLLSTLLTEMDGIGMKIQSANRSSSSQILIVGATNRPDVLDSALMRPGRFDRLIHVPAPDLMSRQKILAVYGKKMPFSSDVNIDELAQETANFSGADLYNLCNEAALNAITKNLEADVISMEDFRNVLREMKPSLTVQQINWYKNFEKQHVCI